MNILGVMTGTSCDGLDAACIEITNDGWKPLWSASAAYPTKLRKTTLSLQKPGTRVAISEWMKLNRDLGNWYGTTLTRLIRKHGEATPHLIANHGQTLAHFPKEGITLQLGDPTRIAHATGITTVSEFRDGDMAAGGQGAPLVPFFHRLLANRLGDSENGVAIHNIGGISNLTYVNSKQEILAFDTGPGNIWIDAAAEIATHGKLKMDVGGKLASRGEVDEKALRALLRHPYFSRSAPKSTGRDDFPLKLLLQKTKTRNADLVATATALTVESIACAYEKVIIKKDLPLAMIYICGGGAKNPSILRGIRERLPKIKVSTLDEVGLNSQLIEAQAFAYFGFMTLMGQPIGGNWTGARSFGPPGHIIPGKNWIELIALIQKLNN